MSKHRHKLRAKKAEGGASMGAKGSYVDKVAHEEGDGGHKHGGRTKRRHGGKIEGKAKSHRLDRPGRKRGGSVGADARPMTEAAKLTQPSAAGKDDQPDEDIRSSRSCGGRSGGERATGGRTDKKWIKGAIKHPGGLHRALHVPEGERIPAAKLAAAKNSENSRVRRMAALAHTLKAMH